MTICRSAGGSPRGRRCGTAGAAGARLLAFTAALLIQCAWAPSPKCPPEHKTIVEQRAAGEALIQSAARGRLEDGTVALACFRKALKQTRPADAQTRGELMVLVADALEASGDLPESDAQLRTVLREFPTSPVPHFKLGNQVMSLPHESGCLRVLLATGLDDLFTLHVQNLPWMANCRAWETLTSHVRVEVVDKSQFARQGSRGSIVLPGALGKRPDPSNRLAWSLGFEPDRNSGE